MSYLPSQIDHLEEGTGKLLDQYLSDYEFFNQIFQVQLDQLNNIEVALQDILCNTGINTATGSTLDILGAIVNITRTSGQTDDSYRTDILAFLTNNVSSGTPNEIINAVKRIVSASNCRYWDYYPANYILEVNGTVIPESLEDTVKRLSPAAIGYFAILSSRKSNVFRPAELSLMVGDLIDNNSNYFVSYDGNETRKIEVAYDSTNYDVNALNISTLPDVVEITDTGEIYLVDQSSNIFTDESGNTFITGIDLGWKYITLTTDNSRLSEVYQYGSTN